MKEATCKRCRQTGQPIMVGATPFCEYCRASIDPLSNAKGFGGQPVHLTYGPGGFWADRVIVTELITPPSTHRDRTRLIQL